MIRSIKCKQIWACFSEYRSRVDSWYRKQIEMPSERKKEKNKMVLATSEAKQD